MKCGYIHGVGSAATFLDTRGSMVGIIIFPKCLVTVSLFKCISYHFKNGLVYCNILQYLFLGKYSINFSGEQDMEFAVIIISSA